MANISSLIPLDAFVRRLLVKEGKDNDDYMRYMQIACAGLRDMHTHDFEVEVTKVVTVNASTNRFSFPSDFVKYKWIATPRDGRWWIYTKEQDLVPLTDDDDVPNTILTALPNIANTNIATSMSDGGGQNRYYFKPDYKNREFQVAGDTPTIVVLKYITNGLDSEGDINIPDYATLALEAYVRAEIADFDAIAESHVIRLKAQYEKKRKMMRKVHRPTLQELKDIIFETTGALRR